jgi:hypothetical protein
MGGSPLFYYWLNIKEIWSRPVPNGGIGPTWSGLARREFPFDFPVIKGSKGNSSGRDRRKKRLDARGFPRCFPHRY